MPKRRFTPEQIIGLLRQAEVELAQGRTVGEVCRSIAISEQTYYPPIRRVRQSASHGPRLT